MRGRLLLDAGCAPALLAPMRPGRHWARYYRCSSRIVEISFRGHDGERLSGVRSVHVQYLPQKFAVSASSHVALLYAQKRDSLAKWL